MSTTSTMGASEASLGEAQQVTLGDATEQAGSKRGLNGHESSGRVRHDEKITVYVSGDELIALERARLELRGERGLSVDRGRIVRAAVAMALDDLRQHGTDSQLVQRLRKK
ncbi:hypothetical protein [Raineyella antarctica]